MANADHPVVERTDSNPFAILTGASRGIGAAYARLLASRGYDLLLVSRDETRLTSLSRELETNHRIRAHVFLTDLAQPDAAHQLFVESRQYRQTPEMLINNAGFGLYGEFIAHPLPRIQEMLQVHVRTVVESIRLFLPGMIERGSGTIINVASIVGLLPIPYFAEYAATKAFLVSFSEALAEEVRETGVVVQACCPGQTETDFHASAGFRPPGRMSMQTADQVAHVSLAALRNKQPVVTIGWQGRLTALVTKWLPRRFLIRTAGRFIRTAARSSPTS
ncbi:MAG: SDR family oxidoreductase [Nitrospira sp.]|nr:SDR family oxidoreductase [Nitrospira sp.]